MQQTDFIGDKSYISQSQTHVTAEEGRDYAGRTYKPIADNSLNPISEKLLESQSNETGKVIIPSSEKELLSFLPENLAAKYNDIKAAFSEKWKDKSISNFIFIGSESFSFKEPDYFFKYLFLDHYSGEDFGFGKQSTTPVNSIALEQFILGLEHAKTADEFHCYLRVKREAVKWLGTVETDQRCPWMSYIVHKPGFASLYKSDLLGQKKYGEMMHHTIKIAAMGLKEGWSFQELLNFFAWRRNFIARTLGAPNWDRVGIKRTSELKFQTELKGVYEALLEKLSKRKASGNGEKEEYGHGESWIQENSLGYVYKAKLNEDEVTLSSICHNDLQHMTLHDSRKVMAYVENELFPKIMEEKNPVKIYQLAGEMFWWICHAKPWALGDPSIAEMLFRTIFKDKVSTFYWSINVIPWIEAMSEPNVKVFAKNFVKLFNVPSLQK